MNGSHTFEPICNFSIALFGGCKEKRQLVDSLWSACYNEPSALCEEILALPGDDALPPEVASKHFEPPLTAWAANQNRDAKP